MDDGCKNSPKGTIFENQILAKIMCFWLTMHMDVLRFNWILWKEIIAFWMIFFKDLCQCKAIQEQCFSSSTTWSFMTMKYLNPKIKMDKNLETSWNCLNELNWITLELYWRMFHLYGVLKLCLCRMCLRQNLENLACLPRSKTQLLDLKSVIIPGFG